MFYKQGQESNVDWFWTNTLGIRLNFGNDIDIPSHPLHVNITGNDSQIFYGGYTVVTAGGYKFSDPKMTYYPTTQNHTEPQYFAWLETQMAHPPQGLRALLIEICQTKTPCSANTCRPFILNCIQSNTIGNVNLPGVIIIARMSARERYESSAATMVSLTSMEYDAIKSMKKGSNKSIKSTDPTPLTLTHGAALHRIPDYF